MREVLRAYQNARRGRGRALRGPCRQVHGRRRAGLLRLAPGARGRGRAGGPGRARRSRRPSARLADAGRRAARGPGRDRDRPRRGRRPGRRGRGAEEAVVGETPNLAARLQALAEPGQRGDRRGARAGSSAACSSSRDLGRARRSRASPSRCAASRVARRAAAPRAASRPCTAGRPDAAGRARAGAGAAARPLAAGQGRARARWCCSRARPGSASRGCVRGAARALARRAAHARSATTARPTTPTARSTRSSTSSSARPGFGATTRRARRLDKLEALLARGADDVGEAAPLLADLLGDRRPATATRRSTLTPAAAARSARFAGPARPARRPGARDGRCWWSSRTCTGSTRPRSSCSTWWSSGSRRLPVLLLVTFRPEFAPPWTGTPHVTAAHAQPPRPRRQAEAMVERVTGGRALPAEVLERDRRRGPTGCRCSSRS